MGWGVLGGTGQQQGVAVVVTDEPLACRHVWPRSEAHNLVNTQTAQEGVVLLKNSGSILPFKRGSKVAVVGPHAVTQRALLEDYYGDEVGSPWR
jgi:beta-glucosidase-like glycosyl hydrolase